MNRCFFSLFLFVGFLSFSQSSVDSLELDFTSTYEEEIFATSLPDNSFNEFFLNVLFAIDSTYTLQKSKIEKAKIDQFLASLEKKVIKYNEAKKVKFLFEKIHDRFFKKYELDSYFSDIFQSSTYNCVTGTALYAYAFDHFKMPYQIKETPTHVFLVVYPKRHNIYVETTLPGKSGSYAPTDGAIRKAVDELVEMKMITQEQVVQQGYNKAFNDYYYGDENITKEELAGIQYYNKAVVNFNDANYEDAYSNILKSRFFYKNEKTKLFSEGLLTLVVDKVDFARIENFKWFIALAEIESKKDLLKYKLADILREDTWSDKEHNIIEAELNDEIANEELRNELLQTTYEIRAERYNKLQQYKNVLIYAEKIYQLNPNHLTAKNFITEAKIQGLAHKNITSDRLKDLNELTNLYPFMSDFGIYIRYKIYLYAYLTHNSFMKDKSSEGLKYLAELETMMDAQLDGVDFNQEGVGNAYGAVGAYYYRSQKKSKAVEYLKRGLKYSPDNQDINRKLKLIENSY